MTANKDNTKMYTMSVLQDWCTLADRTTNYTTPTKPVEGLSAQGASFRKWFLQDDGTGSAPPIWNPNTSYNGGTGSTTGTGSTVTEITKKDPPQTPIDQPLTYEQKISSYIELIEDGKELYNTSVDREYLLDEYIKRAEESIKNSDSILVSNGVTQLDWLQRDLYEDKLNKKIASTANSYLDTYIGYIKSYWKYTAMTLNDCRYAALSKIYDKMPYGLAYEAEFNKAVLKNLFKGTGYLNPGLLGEKYQSTYSVASNINSSTDLLSTNIPLSNNEHTANATPEQANCPAYCMLNKEDTIKLHTTDINGQAVYYGDYAAEALARYNCLLIVEPIISLRMMKQPGITNFAQSCLVKYYDSTYSYGSAWNLIEKWGGSQVCTFVPRLDVYIPNSLVIEKTYTTKSGKQILGVDGSKEFYTDSSRRFTELAEKMNTVSESGGKVNGIALHVYDASDIFKSSSTSTCDEPNSSTPNKSEDCSTFPEESNYPTTSKKVSILKSYETIKSDGTIQNDGYYIRQNTPHTVTIEDEDSINYKVVDWQTLKCYTPLNPTYLMV